MFRKAKNDKWNKFLNSLKLQNLNQEGLESNRNYKPITMPPRRRRVNTITLPDKIADTFSDHTVNISRYPYKKSEPEKHRKNRKEENHLPFNKPFTYRQLKTDIKQQKNTSPG